VLESAVKSLAKKNLIAGKIVLCLDCERAYD
jgi:hypothetical protein